MREPLSVVLVVRSFYQSDRLRSCVWYKFYDQFSSGDILSQGHIIVLSVPCDIGKDWETSFEMNKFSKKNL